MALNSETRLICLLSAEIQGVHFHAWLYLQVFEEPPYWFPQWLHLFVYKGFHFSTPLAHLLPFIFLIDQIGNKPNSHWLPWFLKLNVIDPSWVGTVTPEKRFALELLVCTSQTLCSFPRDRSGLLAPTFMGRNIPEILMYMGKLMCETLSFNQSSVLGGIPHSTR